MSLKIPKEYDSKFRFVLVAAQRAHQILHGAPPKLKVNSDKAAHIAIKEAEANLIRYEILKGEEMPVDEEEP